jgi:tetratricopeptide (TPR) repeat protein
LATLLSAHGAPRHDSDALLQQARLLAETHGDRTGLAETVWNMAQLRMYLAKPDALDYSQQALALAREVASPLLIARSLTVMAHSYTHLGQWDKVVPVADEARQRYAALGERAMEVEQLCILTLQYNNLGQLARSSECGRQALALARQTDNQWGEAYAAFALSMTLVDTGEVAEALALAQQGVMLITPLNVPPLHIVNLLALGNAQLAVGELATAQATLAQAQELNQANGGMRDNAELLANLRCHAARLQGDWENAYMFARQALAARDYSGSLSAAMWRWCEVAALIRHGDSELARQDLANTAPILARSPRLRLAWLWASAYLAHADGDAPTAQSMLQEALQLAEMLSLPRERGQLDAQRTLILASAKGW